jgi:large subunit ribosomal protein L15
MPLTRRLPKRGFVNPHRTRYAIVNVGDLNSLPPHTVVEPTLLREQGYIRGRNTSIKVLGDGEFKTPLTIRAHRFSESAIKKIKAAGGQFEVLS